MGKRVIEVVVCDFCGKEVDKSDALTLDLNGDRGDFDLCHDCGDLFREKFFHVHPQDSDDDDVVGEPDDEYEDEPEDEFDDDEPIGEPEDDYDLDDDFDDEEEDEPAPPPPPKKKVRRPRKKVSKKKTQGRKKKARSQSRYSNPLADIDHSEKDGTRVSPDGTVNEGKVLAKIKQAATSQRRGVIKSCPPGECQHDEDTGRCDECGLKKGESGTDEGAAPAHDPIRAQADGQDEMGIDPFTGACTFPVDINSERVQRRMKKNLRKENEALRKKYGKSGRYFNLDPTDGVGRGR